MIVGFANRTLDWNLGLFLGLARLFNFLETVNVFWFLQEWELVLSGR